MGGTEAHLTASLKEAQLMLLICIHICSINVFSLYEHCCVKVFTLNTYCEYKFIHYEVANKVKGLTVSNKAD